MKNSATRITFELIHSFPIAVDEASGDIEGINPVASGILYLPDGCDHKGTICPECVTSWAQDHELTGLRIDGPGWAAFAAKPLLDIILSVVPIINELNGEP